MPDPRDRSTDPTPFTPLSALSPEAREWRLKVVAAKSRYRQTGDSTELQELGALPRRGELTDAPVEE